MSLFILQYKYITYCFNNHATHSHIFGLLLFWVGNTECNNITECGQEFHTMLHYLSVMSISVLTVIKTSYCPKELEAFHKNKF
jgi:hypothetical protein